jgi:hypothetical protein
MLEHGIAECSQWRVIPKYEGEGGGGDARRSAGRPKGEDGMLLEQVLAQRQANCLELLKR